MKHLVYLILGLILVVQIDSPLIHSATLFSSITLAAFINRQDKNILHLCLGMLVFIAIERIVFLYIPLQSTPQVWANNRIYLVHFVFDLVLLLFLIFRGALSRWYYKKLGKNNSNLYLTNADISMFGVMILFMLVDIAATVENLLRNLDYLGFSEEIAKPLWELNWIYYHYPELKYALMGLQFLVLWSTVSKMAKQKTKYLGRFQG